MSFQCTGNPTPEGNGPMWDWDREAGGHMGYLVLPPGGNLKNSSQKISAAAS